MIGIPRAHAALRCGIPAGSWLPTMSSMGIQRSSLTSFARIDCAVRRSLAIFDWSWRAKCRADSLPILSVDVACNEESTMAVVLLAGRVHAGAVAGLGGSGLGATSGNGP